MNKKPILILICSFAILLVLAQNCGKQKFTSIQENQSIIRCTSGIKLAIWTDKNSDWSIIGETKIGNFVSYSGDLTTRQNYNYYSASAHPVNGPTPQDYMGSVFFYEGSDGLSMNFFFNVDETGSPDNIVNIDIKIRGNNSADSVQISDDGSKTDPNTGVVTPAELLLTQSVAGENSYEGRFHYWSNTDGGAIGPLNGSGYAIQLRFLNLGDVASTSFYSANGTSFPLVQTGSINTVDTFLIKSEGYETCQ